MWDHNKHSHKFQGEGNGPNVSAKRRQNMFCFFSVTNTTRPFGTYPAPISTCSVLFFQPSSIRGLATPWTYFLHLSLSFVILIHSSMESPVHVLMLSIQAVHPSSPACTWHCSWHCSLHYLFLQATPLFPHALTVSNSSFFTLALLRTDSFVFFAVYKTSRIYLCPFIAKASKRVSSFLLRVHVAFTAVRCYRPHQRFH